MRIGKLFILKEIKLTKMEQKHIGTILIIIGILLAGLVYVVKVREDNYIKLVMKQDASCFLEDGTCLHADREIMIYVFGWSMAVVMLLMGVYVGWIDKSQKVLAEHSRKVSGALHKAKVEERKKDEFAAFLAGFSDDEKKVLLAVKEQDGIKQSTLRFRTGISKTGLSILLKDLEEREILSRKKSGKTNEVFLQKKF